MTRPFIFSLTLGLLLFCSKPLAGQNNSTITTIRNLGLENGLVSKLIYCGLADSRGFVWFGTSNGLQRFDGERFRLFTREKNGLQDNNLVRMAEDAHQSLWLLYGLKGTERRSAGRVDILDLGTYRVLSLKEKFGADLPFDETGVTTICSNERREMAIVTMAAGNKSDIFLYGADKKFRKIISGISIDHDYPHHLIFRDSAILFYGNNQTGIVFTSGKSVITKLDLGGADNFFPIGINKEGHFFSSTSAVGEPGKKYQGPVFMKVTGNGETMPLPEQLFLAGQYHDYNKVYFRALYESRTGETLIYQQTRGMFVFTGAKPEQLVDTLALGRFRDLKLYDFFTLAEGQYWVCTSEGVIIISRKINHFDHLLSRPEVFLNGSMNHQVRSIYADTSGNVFINSWGGFFKAVKTVADGYGYEKLMASEKPLFDGFYFDGNHFWIASGDTQVIKYHYPTRKIEKFEADSLRLWSGIVTREGQLLIGAVEGMGKMTGNRFKKIRNCINNLSPQAWVYQFFYSRNGQLYAVSNKGLFEIDQSDCISSRYWAESNDTLYRIPFTDLHYVYEDEKGVFWMATNGAGLIKWNREANTFQQFTIADGLSSNVLYAVLEDDHKSLWISSEYGLMRFNKESNTTYTYTKADGITDNEFNRISYCKGADGRFYFGGLNGVTAFFPKDFISDSNALQVPLEIISFSQFEGKKDRLLDKTSEFLASRSIVMKPGDKFFIIDFQLLDYNIGSHHYAYLIEGIDREWNYIETNSIRISGLPYGDYTLRIKGQNAEGQWSKIELRIPLMVVTPISARWWFRTILVLFCIGIVYLFFRIRTHEIEKSKRALEETVQERTRQLNISLSEKEMLIREVHHRVNNNLQVISGLFELEERNSTDDSLALRIAEGRNRLRSIALIHQNLYKNKNVAAIEINHFLEGLFRQVKEVFITEGKPVEIFSTVPEMELDIETAVPLGLVLNELLTNSFKYAFKAVESGKIHIGLNILEPGKFQLNYKDNGPGLPAGYDFEKSNTMGMQLIFDLTRQIGGRVKYAFEEGSTFSIVFTNNQYRKNSD